ncbi:Rop family plasmid primer RNA-binding protein, partial [Escherichia coli]
MCVEAAPNSAGFIKSQSLTLLEKLDALDADEQAAMCVEAAPNSA